MYNTTTTTNNLLAPGNNGFSRSTNNLLEYEDRWDQSSTPMTFINVIRAEGDRIADNNSAYKYLMSYFGDFGDFKNGYVPPIRLKQRVGKDESYSDLINNLSEEDIHEIFVKRFKRHHVCSKGVNASDELVQIAWLQFKKGVGKIKGPGRPGGKVTYRKLVSEENSDADIEKIFNDNRRKFENLAVGSCRHKMYLELKKMILTFRTPLYDAGTRSSSHAPHLEKYSTEPKPPQPTSLCQAVARMMILVRLSHKQSNSDTRNYKTEQIIEQKKVANDKRATKYNAIKTQMGLDAFNQMKIRDQAAKEIKAAEKVSQSGMSARVAQFVKWRTETSEGKMFDLSPKKGAMSPYDPCVMWRQQFSNTKHLGFTNRRTLAGVTRRCLDNPKMYSNLRIKFNPDATDATSQLYQYAPISGQRPSMLRKTRDADTCRTFRVIGLLKYYSRDSSGCSLPTEHYIQPDRAGIGSPMGGNVYYSLPVKWKDFAKWTGFGVVGNPQKSTYMPTLFKIVNNNIEELSFVAEGKGYKVGYTGGRATSFDKIFEGIRRVPTAAAAAAILAEEEKRRRALASRAKEDERRFREAWKNAGRKIELPKPMPGRDSAKANLATKLANGEIDIDTFNKAFEALNR
jgi:hypothetical protein